MPRDTRPCIECDGDDDQGEMLLCDRCDDPIHAHCVKPPFTGTVGNYWSCPDCTEDQAAVSEGHESEDESDEEDASVAAGA